MSDVPAHERARGAGWRVPFVLGLACLAASGALAVRAVLLGQSWAELRAEALAAFERPAVSLDAALLDPGSALPSVEVSGYPFVAVLEIPEIGLVLPVLEEGAGEPLGVAPCVVVGTPYAADLVIEGGGSDEGLGRLGELSGDERVVVRDALGNSFAYEANGVRDLRPTSLGRALEEGGAGALTLCEVNDAGEVVRLVSCDSVG